MGSDWSREETSQQNEELSKTPCIIEKVVEKTTSASSEIIPRRNGRRIGLKLPHNCEAIVKDADTPLDKLSMDELYDQLYAGVFLNQTRKASPYSPNYNFSYYSRIISSNKNLGMRD